MVEKHPVLDFFSHTLLTLGVVVIVFPIYLALVGSTHSAQDMAQSPIPIWFGQDAWYNYRTILLGEGPGVTSQVPVARMMWVSLVTALTIAFGKIVISLLSAFAIVYFNFPFRKAVFWGIFITLMLPVEVRIVPTYQVVADFGMVNSFAGLTPTRSVDELDSNPNTASSSVAAAPPPTRPPDPRCATLWA